MGNYIFSNSWFDDLAKQNWEILFSHLKPKRILEIGSYEGASACYSIRSESCRELYCIDTWEGGIEHDPALMNEVEVAFDYNIAVAMSSVDREIKVIKRKGVSSQLLPALLHEGHRGSFDFIYVDGSHQAPDVLMDAVFAFELCSLGGVIAFDDYAWSEKRGADRDPIRSPKIAIDAFTNIFCRKITLLNSLPQTQLYVTKISE